MSGRLLRNVGSQENPPRTAVSADLVDFAGGKARVDDDGPGIDLAAGEDESSERDGILACDHHPVSGPNRPAPEVGRDSIDRIGEVAIAPGAAVFGEGRLIGPFGNVSCDDFVQPPRQSFENLGRGQVIDRVRQGALPRLYCWCD